MVEQVPQGPILVEMEHPLGCGLEPVPPSFHHSEH